MKNLLVITLLLVAVVSRSAAQSMLKVRSADNRQINVWLDGRYFNKRGTSVTVGDLPAGTHMLKIYSMVYTRRGRGYEDVIYYGKVRTYQGMITMVYYDPATRQADTKEEYMRDYLNDRPSAAPGEPEGQPGSNRDNSRESNEDNPPASPVASPVQDATGSLTNDKLDKLKTKITAKKVDTERMNLLKEALKNETITTSQVGAMMDWFNFESSKVEFAEWAYTKTVDKENFNDLQSKLSYKNYQEELDKFIRAQ